MQKLGCNLFLKNIYKNHKFHLYVHYKTHFWILSSSILALEFCYFYGNAINFDNEHVDLSTWKRQFKKELGQVCTKAKPTIETHLQEFFKNDFASQLFGVGSCMDGQHMRQVSKNFNLQN